MAIPEWTGAFWQWLLLIIYGGGVSIFVLLFIAAFLLRDYDSH
jgi:hypothetical protein